MIIKRFILICLTLFISLAYASTTTVVRCVGRGETRNQALESAFQEAIRKAVGTFISSNSKASNNVYFEEIIMNSDGMIRNFKELSCKTEFGLISLEIEATVETGTLVANVENKSKNTFVDVNNLLNRKKAIYNARKTIEQLFIRNRYALITGNQIGSLKEVKNTFTRKDKTIFELNYNLKFNSDQYKNIQEKLQSLLNIFAIHKIEGSTYNLTDLYPDKKTTNTHNLSAIEAACSEKVIRKYTNSSFYNLFSNSFISYFTSSPWYEYAIFRATHKCLVSICRFFETCWNFCTRKKYHDFPTEVGIVIFSNQKDVWYSKTPIYNYTLLVIPKLIFDKLEEELADNNAVLVQEFICYNNLQPITTYRQVKCSFSEIKEFKTKKVILLKNTMDLTIDKERFNIIEYNGVSQFSINDNVLKNIQDYRCRIATGEDAKYLTSCYITPSATNIREMAKKGSLRAMMAMATLFNEPNWLHSAALLGSTKAQEILKWKNAGLGFDISQDKNGSYVIGLSATDLNIPQGSILHKINGKTIDNLKIEDLSKLIGSFSHGDKITLEFSNQKTIVVSPIPKENTTLENTSIVEIK